MVKHHFEEETWATDSVVDPMIVREGWVMFTCSLYVPGNMKTVAGAEPLSDAIAAPMALNRKKSTVVCLRGTQNERELAGSGPSLTDNNGAGRRCGTRHGKRRRNR